jgi:hypothetical protein
MVKTSVRLIDQRKDGRSPRPPGLQVRPKGQHERQQYLGLPIDETSTKQVPVSPANAVALTVVQSVPVDDPVLTRVPLVLLMSARTEVPVRGGEPPALGTTTPRNPL